MFVAEALAKQIDEEHLAKNQLYPAFSEIREISAHIGEAVAKKAYELGMLFLSLVYDHSSCYQATSVFEHVLGVDECRIGNTTATAERSLCLC